MVSMSLLVCLLAWFQLMNNPAVTYADAEHQGHLFWITCKWLKLLRNASHLQVIQNLVPLLLGGVNVISELFTVIDQ